MNRDYSNPAYNARSDFSLRAGETVLMRAIETLVHSVLLRAHYTAGRGGVTGGPERDACARVQPLMADGAGPVFASQLHMGRAARAGKDEGERIRRIARTTP